MNHKNADYNRLSDMRSIVFINYSKFQKIRRAL